MMPPTPGTGDLDRWNYTRRSRQMLYGDWMSHLHRRAVHQLGFVRTEAWGTLDLSANPMRAIWDALASLYNVAPNVWHEEADGAQLVQQVAEAGVWPMMRRVQRDTLGLREMLVRVAVAADGALTFRPVFPDYVVAVPDPERPWRPVKIREARPRMHQGREIWAWDEVDISNPEMPTYRVLIDKSTTSEPVDITEEQLGGRFDGDAYPYRRADGIPILPYVLYHAEATGMLWDAYSTCELVEGTLNVAVMYSLLGHVMRSASWDQRYAAGVRVPSTGLVDEDGDGNGRRAITTDPATLLLLEADPDNNGGVVIGQWSASADPEQMATTIAKYERRLANFAGINAADQIRMDGDPRSGYAVAVSRDAQREVQRRYEPQFRAGDLELLSVAAVLANRFTDAGVPEDGYSISYEGVPLSLDERRLQREELSALLEAGLIDRASAYQEIHPGTSRADALRELEEIRRINQTTRM